MTLVDLPLWDQKQEKNYMADYEQSADYIPVPFSDAVLL